MKKHILAYVLAALLALALTQLLRRTGFETGSLSGEVTDPSGAVVPGARILVFGDRRSETFSTDETGKFLLRSLKPGTYEMSVISDGFAPFDRAGLVVTAGHRAEVDANLNLAILKQAVTVTGEAARHTHAKS